MTQHSKHLLFLRIKFVWLAIQDAKCAESVPIAADKRATGEETQVRISFDERILSQLIIRRRVRDNDELPVTDHSIGKGVVAWNFSNRRPLFGFKPLTLPIEKGDQ